MANETFSGLRSNRTRFDKIMELNSTALNALSIIVIFLHSIALCLLIKAKGKRLSSSTNNNTTTMVVLSNFILLVLISSWELLFCVIRIIMDNLDHENVVYEYLLSVNISMGLSISTMYLMTLNRLLVALYPFRYQSSMTKRKFAGLVLSVSITVSAIFTTGSYLFYNSGWKTMLIGGVMNNLVYIVYFVFCISSYILIFKKIINSQQATTTNMQHESSSNTDRMFFWKELRRKGYIIPLLITFTYLIFVVLPVFASDVCFFIGSRPLYYAEMVRMTMYMLNNISDVLIYVFCDRDIQSLIKNIFARFMGSTQSDTNTNDTEMSVVNP